MKTTIRKFTYFLTSCLLGCSVQAQRGPQDTWYETGKVALPTNCDPYDLIVTPEGTLLLSDYGNDKIHELEANGSLIRSFGSLGSGNGQFNNPIELAIGPGNRIYVTDLDNHRIQILERNGTFVKAFGTSGSGDGQFNKPRGLAISSDNEVFVSEDGNHRIQVFDANGTFLRKWGSLGNLDGQLNRPLSLDVDNNLNVIVADYSNNRIQIFSKSGDFLNKFTTLCSGLDYPYSKVAFVTWLGVGGILATGGETNGIHQDQVIFRTLSGSLLHRINVSVTSRWGNWSPTTQLTDGTIVRAFRSTKKLLFFKQTYRTIRPNPSKDAPLPEVISVTQPAGTNHLEIKYRITDADSAKVKAGLLAFKDGGNDLTKVIVPKTFVGSIAGKLDENTTTGTIHTVTWDAKADWNVSYGNVELAVVAQDDRELMNFHFLTLPATDSNSTPLKISRSPITNGDCLNAWYTLLALENNDFAIDGNEIRANSGVVYTSSSGTTTNSAGREYLFNKMNLRQATTAELTRAREAATPGVTNKFTPSFKVGPGERPVKVNEYGFDSDSTSSSHYWVVPKN
jgi:streptogramin lyase